MQASIFFYLNLLLTVVFGCFPKPKKCQVLSKKWTFGASKKLTIYFYHFSFFPECRSVELISDKLDYRFDPYRCAFYWFLFCYNFLSFFEKNKNNIPVVGNVPGNFFSLIFPEIYLFGRFRLFSEGPKLLKKTQNKTFFLHTNQFFILVHPQVATKDN